MSVLVHHRVLTAIVLTALASLVRGEAQEAWDVSSPPGDRQDVVIDTSEGTWLNLDVHPNGGEVAFDLLGDIYVVSLTGDARAISSGIAWDMQPRYSPDGEWIAFTSDRGGGDNIWIMRRDGSDPRAVTKESFRLVNDPVWTPDGNYIAARKHFTSRRSLGAGEIWLWHRDGGSGLPLVTRPTEQKDLGEPAFSPDGRFLYYSLDATPGPTFEYNKDSNGEIYVIRRLDRETGDTTDAVNGPGGAVRPTPSPDGTRLAFVRRVRGESELWVKDLASGGEARLVRGLDRDMQETWAIHGVYPRMAWTSDSTSIVFWSGGHIHRLRVSTRELSTIPFHVSDTRSVAPALRHPIAVWEPTFRARMLRGVTVSPDEREAVFEAVGKLWRRELTSGESRRLTEASDVFERHASFSRAGDRVAYSTWNDASLGEIREVELSTGEVRKLTTAPGHYAEPVYDPDTRHIVYRKLSGGGLVDPRWSEETGLWCLDLASGETRRIAASGSRPHFAAESDRVFFLGYAAGKVALRSVDLQGREVRDHVTSENAVELRVSPDGRSLAFKERFRLFSLPFPRTGGTFDVAPGTSALPIVELSDDSGDFLEWSTDGTRLHWTLGSTLHSLPVPKSAEKNAEGTAKPVVTDLSIEVPSDRPTGRTAYIGARIITMDGDRVLERGTVIVEDNRIESVWDEVPDQLPEGVEIVVADGLTIIPGIVDVHAHGAQGVGGTVPQQNWISYAELAFGVTTIHDPSNDTQTIFAASELARAGEIVSPRIFSTGTILYGAAGAAKAEIDSLDDALFHLRRMKAVGAFSVKSYNQPRRDQRQQVVTAARELDMMVVPEGGSLFQHNMTMLIDGHTGVEHCLPVGRIYDDVRDLWSQTGTGYTPTLVVAYGGLSGEYYWYQHTDVWKNERLAAFVPRSVLDARSRRRPMAPEEEYGHFANARVAKQLLDAGVKVNVGGHGQREGLGAHWEMWMLVQGGFTPLEAIRAATLHGAAYLGLDGDIGSVEAGKLADLVFIEENPLDDIRHSEAIRWTMVNGRLYDARTMDEIRPRRLERRRFFFEDEGAPAVMAPTVTCGCGHTDS